MLTCGPSTRTATLVPRSTVGTEYRAEPTRTVDNVSTVRVTGGGPMLGRSDDNGVSSSRSRVSRSAGTAQISLCTAALTSMHHPTARWFAAVRSANTMAMTRDWSIVTPSLP